MTIRNFNFRPLLTGSFASIILGLWVSVFTVPLLLLAYGRSEVSVADYFLGASVLSGMILIAWVVIYVLRYRKDA